ncbi:MAG: hypothetical protein LBH02_00800 [Methanocalculaceae archaeon]|nr:hypothetical protein [Methanocalculaceae archaeon]
MFARESRATQTNVIEQYIRDHQTRYSEQLYCEMCDINIALKISGKIGKIHLD